MDGQLNDQHKNTTPDGWTDRELYGQNSKITLDTFIYGDLNDQHKKNQMDEWIAIVMVGTKITPSKWMDRELNDQHKIPHRRNGRIES